MAEKIDKAEDGIRQEDRIKRRNFKYTSIPEERQFRHYNLKVDEYDDPQKGEHTNFKVQNIPKHGQFHYLHLDEYEMIPEGELTSYETQEIPDPQQFHHRFVKLHEYDYPEKRDFRKYNERNYNVFLSPIETYLGILKKKFVLPYISKRQMTTERQIGILAGIIGIIIWALSPLVSPLVISVVKNGKPLNINIKYLHKLLKKWGI